MKVPQSSTPADRAELRKEKLQHKQAIRDRIWWLVNTARNRGWRMTGEERKELNRYGYRRRT